MSSMDRCPRVANLQRTTWIAVLAAAMLLVTACSGDNAAESPRLPTSAQISTDGVRVGLAGYEVFASPAVGAGATLAIADGAGVAPVVAEAASSWLAPMSPTVRITLDDNRQPNVPLRLSYTLPQGFTPPANAVPVAVARSADGTVDLVEARMEGDSVVADLLHLSWEVFAWFRPEELTKKLVEYVSPILGTGSPRPECEGKPLVFPALVETVSPVSNGIAWSCIMTTPGSNAMEPSVSIQLAVNSPFAWQLAAEPAALRVVSVSTDAANEYLRSLYRRIAGNTVIAGPGDVVRLEFGQYEMSPRTGTLTRNPSWDTTALSAWAYEEALSSAFPGPAKFFSFADALLDCSQGFEQFERIAADILDCSQSFAAAGVRLLFGRTAVAFVSQLADKVGPGTATTGSWTVYSRSLRSSNPASNPDVVLGRADNEYSVGYGTARPQTLSLNSLCANTISDITWESWGGPSAVGRGLVCAPAGSPDTGGPSTITAMDLGDCFGQRAYRRVLINGELAWNVCNGG